MNLEKLQEYLDLITDWAIAFAPKLLMSVLVVFIGLFIVKKLSKLIRIALEKANFEAEIVGFLGSLIDIVMKVIVFLFAASLVGVKMTALIGLVAAAGFAIGMALQGFLGNFASGLTILFFKPYRVDDWVKVSDHFGKVKSIQIFNTILDTPNDKTLVIPNGQVTDNIITNFSTNGNIRLELNVSMGYEESFPRVKEIISTALKSCNSILQNPEPHIGIEGYDSHNITLAIRPFIHPDSYWESTFEVYEKIKEAFHKNNVKAAYSEGVELGPIGA